MYIKNIIVFLVLIISLLSYTKVVADPLEIAYRSPNIKVYAFEQVLNRWGEKQWSYFSEIIYRESKWNSEAKNPKSSAYGLGQFLNSTWEIVDCKKTKDPYKQIDCTMDYIELNYKTPYKAIQFHNRNNYY